MAYNHCEYCNRTTNVMSTVVQCIYGEIIQRYVTHTYIYITHTLYIEKYNT